MVVVKRNSGIWIEGGARHFKGVSDESVFSMHSSRGAGGKKLLKADFPLLLTFIFHSSS